MVVHCDTSPLRDSVTESLLNMLRENREDSQHIFSTTFWQEERFKKRNSKDVRLSWNITHQAKEYNIRYRQIRCKVTSDVELGGVSSNQFHRYIQTPSWTSCSSVRLTALQQQNNKNCSWLKVSKAKKNYG